MQWISTFCNMSRNETQSSEFVAASRNPFRSEMFCNRIFLLANVVLVQLTVVVIMHNAIGMACLVIPVTPKYDSTCYNFSSVAHVLLFWTQLLPRPNTYKKNVQKNVRKSFYTEKLVGRNQKIRK